MHARYCNLVMVAGLVNFRMRGHHGRMHGTQLRSGSLEISAGSKTRKHLGHAMLAACHHSCREMMRAGDDVGDHLRFHWIRNGWFQNANDCCGTAALKAAKADYLPKHAS